VTIDTARATDLRRDINDPAVITQLMQSHGFGDMDAGLDTRIELGEWQRQWEEGPFDKRIPAVSSDQGRTLLGLASPNEIIAFLNGEEASLDVGGVCDFIPRQSIMIIGRLVEFWPFLATLNDQYDVRMMVNGEEAVTAIDDDIPPDLVLIEGGNVDFKAMDVCIAVIATVKGRDIPIVIIDPTHDPDREKDTL